MREQTKRPHPYLAELIPDESVYDDYGIKDKRKCDRYRQQRNKYGFDERETWNMDSAFCQWLYERVMYFKKFATVDMDAEEIEYKGYTMTLTALTDLLLSLLRTYICRSPADEDNEETFSDICSIWKVIGTAMWW